MSAPDLIKTELGLLPKNWLVKPLGEICEKPTYGYTDSASKSGNARFLRITDITDNGVDWAEVPFCNCPVDKLKSYLLKDDDIVFARIGATTGKSYIIKNPPVAVYASYLIRVRAKEEINPQFLYYFFKSRAYWQQVDANKKSNLKQGVNGSILQKLFVPKPSKGEQGNISQILSLIQSAIQKQEQIINTTTELKNALMKKFFTEGLNNEPIKETEIGLIPESWEVVKLGDIADVLSGGTPSRTQPTYWKNGAIPWVKTGEIHYSEITDTEEKITELGYKNSSARLCKKGTLLMAMYGQGITRGRVATLGIDATFNQACAAIIPKSEAKIRTMFLYFLFENNYENIRTLGHGANQRNLSGALIKLIKIPIPKIISEQDEIILTMEAVGKKLNLHKRKKKFLEYLFNSALHQLMTGNIRVNELAFAVKEEI